MMEVGYRKIFTWWLEKWNIKKDPNSTSRDGLALESLAKFFLKGQLVNISESWAIWSLLQLFDSDFLAQKPP